MSVADLLTVGRWVFAAFLAAWIGLPSSSAQDNAAVDGVLIDLPLPISTSDASGLIRQLDSISGSSPSSGPRRTVVLHLITAANAGEAAGKTQFEDALRITRRLTDPSLRSIRPVVWVDTVVNDHAAMLPLGAQQILMSSKARIESISGPIDDTFAINYAAIANRRGVVPPPLAESIADPSRPLAWVTTTAGQRRLAGGQDLQALRDGGTVTREDVWADRTTPLSVNANRLRDAQVVAKIVDNVNQVAAHLDLASLKPLDSQSLVTDPVAVRLDIVGPIVGSRTRRWQSNLIGAGADTNTVFVTIDSAGGETSASIDLAATLLDPPAGIVAAPGVVTGSARGDAALVALACDPLYLLPDATIGGGGNDSFGQSKDVDPELIRLIAQRTGRSSGLIDGLLHRAENVYRYTNRRTGAVAYGSSNNPAAGADARVAPAIDDLDLESDDWQRGEKIELADGLSAAAAVELGLSDGIVDSVAAASVQSGLTALPPPLTDRKLVRFIEKLGSNTFFSFLLVSIGLMALSGEMNAPGFGVPGFISMLCFAMFFWIRFLNGTAEWFELIVLALGLICIGIEIFVVPGVGVFGIGGLLLTVLGIVLMSQTFIIPQNDYQLAILSRSVWSALGGLILMMVAFAAFRMFLPSLPVFRGLVMETGDAEVVEMKERLGDFSHLVGAVGTAATVMRPSGKANFGGEIVPVVSDGSVIEKGDSVRVCEVRGTRIVVESNEV